MKKIYIINEDIIAYLRRPSLMHQCTIDAHALALNYRSFKFNIGAYAADECGVQTAAALQKGRNRQSEQANEWMREKFWQYLYGK